MPLILLAPSLENNDCAAMDCSIRQLALGVEAIYILWGPRCSENWCLRIKGLLSDRVCCWSFERVSGMCKGVDGPEDQIEMKKSI
jgi:hypothetical protein